MERKNRTISVVITLYEEYDYLGPAIESVLSQTLLPDQIIVIDDGSKLDTGREITQVYKENSSHVEIRYFKKKNGGASSARNYGIQKSSGDYITFLDVDDKMLPNNLEEKYKLIQTVSSEYFGVYGGGITSKGKKQNFSNIDGSIDPSLIDVEVKGIPGAVYYYLFTRCSLVEANGFDETLKYYEDYDLLIRLLKSGKKCKGSTSIGYYRNLRENSLSRPKDPLPQLNSVMNFLKKAEQLKYYEEDYLNYRKMEAHIYPIKVFIMKGELIKAIKLARKAFKLHKPLTKKQKAVYLASLSFL